MALVKDFIIKPKVSSTFTSPVSVRDISLSISQAVNEEEPTLGSFPEPADVHGGMISRKGSFSGAYSDSDTAMAAVEAAAETNTELDVQYTLGGQSYDAKARVSNWSVDQKCSDGSPATFKGDIVIYSPTETAEGGS